MLIIDSILIAARVVSYPDFVSVDPNPLMVEAQATEPISHFDIQQQSREHIQFEIER